MSHETFDEVRLLSKVRVNDLERDFALETLVGAPIHGCHATAGNAGGDGVPIIEDGAKERVRCFHDFYNTCKAGQSAVD